jgi:hypothetical protein
VAPSGCGFQPHSCLLILPLLVPIPTTSADRHSKIRDSKWIIRVGRTIAKADSRGTGFDPGAVHVGFVVDTGTDFSSSTSHFSLSVSLHQRSILVY